MVVAVPNPCLPTPNSLWSTPAAQPTDSNQHRTAQNTQTPRLPTTQSTRSQEAPPPTKKAPYAQGSKSAHLQAALDALQAAHAAMKRTRNATSNGKNNKNVRRSTGERNPRHVRLLSFLFIFVVACCVGTFILSVSSIFLRFREDIGLDWYII